MSAGQVSEYTGVAASLDDLPRAQGLLGNRGYEAGWFRDASRPESLALHPGRGPRDKPVRYDKRRYRRHSRVEGC